MLLSNGLKHLEVPKLLVITAKKVSSHSTISTGTSGLNTLKLKKQTNSANFNIINKLSVFILPLT
ncbi:hypothetical protein EXN66_Car020484 [Channa argus]|uniref:Uncharacterized protein n=1 Tax=Channa argus TaxID=215402 RepID=A0A6G1QQN2_CHAAH|nr:hypothetical protein EXN66_Car020484 [Channa argus]